MANSTRAGGWLCAMAGAALLAGSAAIPPMTGAQVAGVKASTGPARSADLKTAAAVPAVAWPADLVINRPTIPMADYMAAKSAAAAHPAPSGQAKPSAAPPATNLSLYTQVASTNESQTTGGNVLPPGGDVATSADWMVQVNNDIVTMYNWIDGTFKQVSLATLYQDGTDALFDPRVIYDPYWDRFVVLTDACNPCSGAGTQSHFELAVSKTGDPSGAWWIRSLSTITGTGDFVDFPQLGMDLNSIIFTFNDFKANNTFEGRIGSLAKAHLYNGRQSNYSIFGGAGCTVAPPYVMDANGVDYVLAFCPGDTKVHIGSLRDTGLSTVSLHLWDNTVNVAYSGIPPQAVQPGASYPLDTGDNRFENRSVQYLDRIWNTATIDIGGGFPAPAWYDFNLFTKPPTLQSQGVWYASNSSYDWHPSINLNTYIETLGTWMSTDSQNNVNVQLRAIGGIDDDAGSGPGGVVVYTSPRPLTGQTDSKGIHRTGDYSYIALYPVPALGCAAGEVGIVEGETAGPSLGLWGTHIGIVKHC